MGIREEECPGWGRMVPVVAGVSLLLATGAGATLRINGSTTVNPVAAEAAEILRAERGMEITVDTQGGSSGGIAGIGDHSIDLGMSSKPISEDDRRRWPEVDFAATPIGEDAVAMVVSRDVWEGGVRSLSRDQVRAIYESRITNWKQVGGPDRPIVLFDKEPGRGTWEVFAHWAYGDAREAPEVRHRQVGGNEEARAKAASTRGAVTQLSFAWAAESEEVFALGITLDDGTVVEPSAETIADHRYPMSRSLLFVTDGPPKGDAKTLVDFVLSRRGQALVAKHGYLPLPAVESGRGR